MTARKRPSARGSQDGPETNRSVDPWPAAGAAATPDSDNPKLQSAFEAMQLEVALYIESISAELGVMARESKLEGLAYFIDMARIEASIQVARRAGDIDGAQPDP